MIEPIDIRRPLGDHVASARLYYGVSCMESLRELETQAIQCVVTSPPYWGLRDYEGDPQVWGDGWCGQLGLEPTPQMYVQHLVDVFREVRRVLRDDGVLWLNLGDSYARGRTGRDDEQRMADDPEHWVRQPTGGPSKDRALPSGLKEKDLVGIPWRVAFALQEDGWYLRSDIIWSKGSVMPESVTDRPTRAHEYLFLMTKEARYFYDADAIREPISTKPQGRKTIEANSDEGRPDHRKASMSYRYDGIFPGNPGGRNKRTVWAINPRPYRGSHFATFPPELVEPCVLAGTSEKGACPMCGGAWKRAVEREHLEADVVVSDGRKDLHGPTYSRHKQRIPGGQSLVSTRAVDERWEPSCACPVQEPVPCRVLDPFSGSGTTGAVCLDRGRDFVGLDINAEYMDLAVARLLGEGAPPREKDRETLGGILEILGVEDE